MSTSPKSHNTNNESGRKNNLKNHEPENPRSSVYSGVPSYEKIRDDEEYEYFRRPKKGSRKKSKHSSSSSSSHKPVEYNLPERGPLKSLEKNKTDNLSKVTGGVVKEDEYIGQPLGLRF